MRLPIDTSDDLRTGSFNRSKPTAHGGWLVPLWAIPHRFRNVGASATEATKKENKDEQA